MLQSQKWIMSNEVLRSWIIFIAFNNVLNYNKKYNLQLLYNNEKGHHTLFTFTIS